MGRWITLEELAEERKLDPNVLHLMVLQLMIPHRRMLGRIYVNTDEIKRWDAMQNGKII